MYVGTGQDAHEGVAHLNQQLVNNPVYYCHPTYLMETDCEQSVLGGKQRLVNRHINTYLKG